MQTPVAIHLRDARRDERLAGQISAPVFVGEPALDVLAQRNRVAPATDVFERLRNDVVIHQKSRM